MSTRQSDLWGWRPEFDSGGAQVVTRRAEAPRVSVAPLLAAVATWRSVHGDGVNDVWYLVAAVNATDDIIAGERLKAGGPDCAVLLPGGVAVLESASPITRLDLVAVGDTTSGTLSAGEIVDIADTAVQYQTAMRTFTFDSGDLVGAVQAALSDRVGAAGVPVATANFVHAYLRGLSYA